MQFNVGQLLREPIGTTSKYNLDEAVDPLEDGTREAVRGWVRLTRTDKGIWVLGALETGALGICSRCLDSYRQGVKLSLDDQYYPLSDPLSGVRTPASLLDQGFTIDARHVLDLRENVRQAVIASLPMKPLCRPSCRGICDQCGARLNEQACRCEEIHVRSPLSALASLISKTQDVI